MQIETIPEGTHRPFWSVMIPTYNCAHTLRQTLQSVLGQDPGPGEMQIEVVDDCSTSDDPEAVVREVGAGRVAFYRQSQNVGPTRTFNTCLERSRGQWIHLLHGDDFVLPGFYSSLKNPIDGSADIGMAFTRHVVVDENGFWVRISESLGVNRGRLPRFESKIGVKQLVPFASIVVKRSAYRSLGGFDTRFVHAADWDMWKRLTAEFGVYHDPAVLAVYREHSNSHTGTLLRSGQNIAEARMSVHLSQSMYPAVYCNRISRAALKNRAIAALSQVRRFLLRGDLPGSLAQSKEAVRCCALSMAVGNGLKISGPEPGWRISPLGFHRSH